MTIDQATEYLLSNTEWRKDTDVTANHITTWRVRYKKGKLNDLAKLNIIRRSGLFNETLTFELKHL